MVSSVYVEGARCDEVMNELMRIIGTTALAIHLFLLNPSPSLGQSSRDLPKHDDPKNNASSKRQATLELIIYCTGMCGTQGSEQSFRLYEDKTAEYQVSNSGHPLPDKEDRTLISKSTRLSTDEFNEFMNLAESPDFLSSKVEYDSGISLVDVVYTTTVIYRRGGRWKTVFLRTTYRARLDQRMTRPSH